MADNDYHYGLKKQHGTSGYFWCPTWKLYNDSEGDYERYCDADVECAKRNLALVIERGIADQIVSWSMLRDKKDHHVVMIPVRESDGTEKVYAVKHMKPTYRQYYEGVIKSGGFGRK
jgi:hypothetical protein